MKLRLKKNEKFIFAIKDCLANMEKDDNVNVDKRLRSMMEDLAEGKIIEIQENEETDNENGYLMVPVGYEPQQGDFTIMLPKEMMLDEDEYQKAKYLEQTSA